MKRLFGILLWALFCLFGTQLSFGQNNREQVLALQRQAIELMDNGDPDQGIVLLRQALTLDPDYWPLTYEMAYAYMVKRDYQKAIKLAKTLYKYEDCNDLVYQLVGNCYELSEESEKSLESLCAGAQTLSRFGRSLSGAGGRFGNAGALRRSGRFFRKRHQRSSDVPVELLPGGPVLCLFHQQGLEPDLWRDNDEPATQRRPE